MKNVFLCLALLVALAGCASTPKLDQQSSQADVRIDPVVAIPTDMAYLGPGSAFGALFGAVGGAISAAANQGPGDRLSQFAKDNGVHIDQIVLEEATKAFRESGKLRLTDTQGANTATLKVWVAVYGFVTPNGFSSDLVPVLNVHCQLTGADGKVIWSAHDVAQMPSSFEGNTPDEFKANPKLIGDSWRAAARLVMKEIVDHM